MAPLNGDPRGNLPRGWMGVLAPPRHFPQPTLPQTCTLLAQRDRPACSRGGGPDPCVPQEGGLDPMCPREGVWTPCAPGEGVRTPCFRPRRGSGPRVSPGRGVWIPVSPWGWGLTPCVPPRRGSRPHVPHQGGQAGPLEQPPPNSTQPRQGSPPSCPRRGPQPWGVPSPTGVPVGCSTHPPGVAGGRWGGAGRGVGGAAQAAVEGGVTHSRQI